MEQSEIAPEANMQIEAQFAQTTNAQSATIQERLEGAIHPELTEKLHLFEKTFQRMPESFYEFSNRMMDSVPPVPPGMRFEIDSLDKTVKVVKK